VKVIKTASGRSKIKLSHKEWKAIGKKAGWFGGGRGNQFTEESVERFQDSGDPGHLTNVPERHEPTEEELATSERIRDINSMSPNDLIDTAKIGLSKMLGHPNIHGESLKYFQSDVLSKMLDTNLRRELFWPEGEPESWSEQVAAVDLSKFDQFASAMPTQALQQWVKRMLSANVI